MERLLIVEDDRSLNRGLCKALQAQNRQVISCHSIADARAQHLLGDISLVLLDVNLPDGSGIDRSARSGDQEGVGIGLYLAREILAGEGGYIKVASDMGRGSVFSVFLPA